MIEARTPVVRTNQSPLLLGTDILVFSKMVSCPVASPERAILSDTADGMIGWKCDHDLNLQYSILAAHFLHISLC